MRKTLDEVWEFLCRFYKHWVSSVGGTVAICFGVIQDVRGGLTLPFWVGGAIALLVAGFLTWRDSYRESRPYSAETDAFVRRHWVEQTPERRELLRRLLIEKQLRADATINLESCRFVARNFQGMYSILPEFGQALAKVASEEDSGHQSKSPDIFSAA